MYQTLQCEGLKWKLTLVQDRHHISLAQGSIREVTAQLLDGLTLRVLPDSTVLHYIKEIRRLKGWTQ